MLTLVHLDHPKALEGADDILRLDAGHLRNVPNLQIILLGMLGKESEKDVRPVRAVRYLPQITQRLLRTAGLALPLAQLVRQADNELAVAALLILRKGQDTGQIVLLGRHLLLGEVAHNMSTFLIDLGHDVKVERIDVVVQSLVIEEELGQEAKILAVDTVVLAVNLKDTERSLAVDLPSRWTTVGTVPPVAAEGTLPLHVFETVLADVEQLFVGILLRIG